MATPGLSIIQGEHSNLSRVLLCLQRLVTTLGEPPTKPDSALLFLILHYIEAFPETFHHPKEEGHLFKRLRAARPAAAPLLDQLSNEHASGTKYLGDLRSSLEALLIAFNMHAAAREGFRQAATAYLDFERKHMQREEKEIFPLALEALTEDDWSDIAAAFTVHDDPVFGAARQKEFDELRDATQALVPDSGESHPP